jgi:hypothetical protein
LQGGKGSRARNKPNARAQWPAAPGAGCVFTGWFQPQAAFFGDQLMERSVESILLSNSLKTQQAVYPASEGPTPTVLFFEGREGLGKISGTSAALALDHARHERPFIASQL